MTDTNYLYEYFLKKSADSEEVPKNEEEDDEKEKDQQSK